MTIYPGPYVVVNCGTSTLTKRHDDYLSDVFVKRYKGKPTGYS